MTTGTSKRGGTIRRSVASDTLVVGSSLRKADLLELRAVHGPWVEPVRVLLDGLHLSDWPATFEAGGMPVGMAGIVRTREDWWRSAPHAQLLGLDQPGTGIVWLLGTDGLTADWRWFLRASRALLEEHAVGYARLLNVVDARHEQALRWLGWLGFTLRPIGAWGVEGRTFVLAERGVT